MNTIKRTLLFALAMLSILAAPVDALSQASAVADQLPAGAADRLTASPDDVTGAGGMQLSEAVEVAIVLTVLSLVPAILISLTCFTRIVIVLSFVRRSLAVQELPPNPILIGLALFLTTFVMAPVFSEVYDDAYLPYKEGALEMEEAGEVAWGSVRGFLIKNTRQPELDLFVELAELEPEPESSGAALTSDQLPFRVVVPAFVLSELKTAFQMGFLLFLPFLVIDLVVASILISMGMFMLPPVMISTPFKILLFVLVDGWRLVCESLVTSFTL
jgi:flagellar biosynthetic protein FliP